MKKTLSFFFFRIYVYKKHWTFKKSHKKKVQCCDLWNLVPHLKLTSLDRLIIISLSKREELSTWYFSLLDNVQQWYICLYKPVVSKESTSYRFLIMCVDEKMNILFLITFSSKITFCSLRVCSDLGGGYRRTRWSNSCGSGNWGSRRGRGRTANCLRWCLGRNRWFFRLWRPPH